ncbi:MAG: hypothetical protein NXI32_12285 [bacterium]|nr:hypothetical protein [bacterium]
MKKISLCATVALICCGTSSLFGQIRLGDASAFRLQEDINSPSDIRPAEAPIGLNAEAEIPDPFTFLDDSDGSIPPLSPEATAAQQAPALEIQPQADMDPSLTDPKSLPVRTNLPKNSVVDTMVNDDTVASIPNAALQPVDWCYGQMRAPNHVADYLMRQECVNGLWDNYPAQRAAECAHMWKHLTAKKKCRCGHGCNTACGSCPTNRYVSENCDSCTHCAATANAAAMQQAEQMAKLGTSAVR